MNNNVIKILIPLVAVIVIVESVVLIQKTAKNEPAPTADYKMSANKVEKISPKDTQPPAEAQVSLVFGTDSKTMKKGESRIVSLNMVPRSDYSFDALDLYVKYDPKAFEVTGLDYNRMLTKPLINKVSTKVPGLIVTQILDSKPEGMPVAGGVSLELISFKITAKSEGKFVFDVNKGKTGEEASTILVDNETRNTVPFSSNRLEINVLN